MTALQRGSGDSSRPVADTNEVLQMSGIDPHINSSLVDRPPSPQPTTAHSLSTLPSGYSKVDSHHDSTVMEDIAADNTLAAPGRSQITAEVDIVRSAQRSASRSSSLSELADTVEREDQSTDRSPPESEAETERLEVTPRKPRTTTDVAALGRTPSKLANEIYMDDENVDPGSPSARRKHTAGISVSKGGANTKDLHLDSDEELSGKKRKRTRDDSSPLDDDLDVDAPPRKRSVSAKIDIIDGEGDMEVVEQTAEDDAMEEAIALAQEPEQEEVEALVESIEHQASSGRTTKGKKGKRKGKQAKASDTNDRTEGAETGRTVPDGDEVVEGEVESEETGSPDEELNRRKAAFDSLGGIEKLFVAFREQNLVEQIEQCERELKLLQQPNSQHPEYLLMLKPIDERRDKKIKEENFRIDYQHKHLMQKTVAEREQLHSQYRQEVRDIRESALEKCHEYLYQLQKDRRRCGADEKDYTIKFNPKRSVQIQQQAAYNLEVSILAGVSKYIGFPAAPQITSVRDQDATLDLQAMGIDTRPPPYTLPRPFRSPSRADRAAAEEAFFEQNAWANPQHPAHHSYTVNSLHHGRPIPTATATATAGGLFNTPAAQMRTVDLHNGPNGSASTIEVQSNPPSSAAAPAGVQQAVLGLAESPVLLAKRAPSGLGPSRLSDVTVDMAEANRLFFETPASQRRASLPPVEVGMGLKGTPAPVMVQPFPTSGIHGEGREGEGEGLGEGVADGELTTTATQPAPAMPSMPVAAAVGVAR